MEYAMELIDILPDLVKVLLSIIAACLTVIGFFLSGILQNVKAMRTQLVNNTTETKINAEKIGNLNADVQELKGSVMGINRELHDIRERLPK